MTEPATTTAPSTTTAPTRPTPATVPPTTVVPTITTKPVAGPSGTVATLTSITGEGDATVALPANVGRPAIVHAQYDGTASFVVESLDAHGRHLAILAHSLGIYDGTFPVGFIDQANAPTAKLRVATTGPWQLDVAKPFLAHPLTGGGVAGHGDAVLSYTGAATSAHVTFPGTTAFSVDIFGGGKGQVKLVRTVGPYDGRIALPAGPAFVSVTAAGDWSMSLG